MCKYGTLTELEVTICARDEYGGHHRKVKKIDFCIAHLVKALDDANILMLSSCCGHKKMDGHIWLHDGRMLVIKNRRVYI